jgi:Icc-related predicted phosphoesterase
LNCLFVSDLHGDEGRYESLFRSIRSEEPDAVFLGGDLLSHHAASAEFVEETFLAEVRRLRARSRRPFRCFVILGNDDPRAFEEIFLEADQRGWIDYVHDRTVPFGPLFVTGYSFVPPTPFLRKDWEKYDVSRHVDPGSVSPEDGHRTVPVPRRRIRYETIAADLERLASSAPAERTIFLLHAPPYDSVLDRAALDGRMVDHVPLDIHVGSIAVARLIQDHRPLLTLHGHVHESPRLTGEWRQRFGPTWAFSGCHDGEGLALVRFDTGRLSEAERTIVETRENRRDD